MDAGIVPGRYPTQQGMVAVGSVHLPTLRNASDGCVWVPLLIRPLLWVGRFVDEVVVCLLRSMECVEGFLISTQHGWDRQKHDNHHKHHCRIENQVRHSKLLYGRRR